MLAPIAQPSEIPPTPAERPDFVKAYPDATLDRKGQWIVVRNGKKFQVTP